MDAGAGLSRAAAGKPGDEQPTRRDADADSLRLGETSRHCVSVFGCEVSKERFAPLKIKDVANLCFAAEPRTSESSISKIPSDPGCSLQQQIDQEIRGLIKRMSRENPTWGVPRI